MADITVTDRDRLRLAGIDPETEAILARHIRTETAVALVAGLAVSIGGAVAAATPPGAGWWCLLAVAVGAAFGGGSWVRSRRWVAKVRHALNAPDHAWIWQAHFGDEPLRLYPHLPGPIHIDLSVSDPAGRPRRVPLMDGQHPPVRWQPLLTVTVIAGPRPHCRPTVIFADDTILFASPEPISNRLRRTPRRNDRLSP